MQSEVRVFLAKAAIGCGGLLNSLMVMLGDKLGIYQTGQYSSDTEDDSDPGTLQPPGAHRVTHKPRAVYVPPERSGANAHVGTEPNTIA
jgi:hypothetical protein